MNIYVMTNGFVVCGVPRDGGPGSLLTLDTCGVIRRYGTTKGLGELADRGPLSDTIIDRDPDGTQLNLLYVMRALPCNEQAWSNWMGSRSESKQTTARSRGR